MPAHCITLKFPESKAVAEVKYFPKTQVAEYTLHGGGTYRSHAVPYGLMSRWGRAKSAGEFYSEHIKGKFKTEKLAWQETR